MTKAQEREALKKIQKIIEEAGPDSYIGMTFAGIVEQAEDNITNDFANNYKALYETSEKNYSDLYYERQELKRQAKDLQEQMKTITGALEAAQAKNQEQRKAYEDMCEKAAEYARDVRIRQDKVDFLESEIINLKAKLYDLMTA